MIGPIQDTCVIVITVITARPEDLKPTPTTPLHISGIHTDSLKMNDRCTLKQCRPDVSPFATRFYFV